MVEADPRFPDARAAATLIENLNNLLPAIDLPHEPLIQEAEFLEAQLQSMMEGANIETPEGGTSNSMLYG
jgi:predicted ATP-grasp superfamily ATP-dependent carboligase